MTHIVIKHKHGPLFEKTRFKDTKDPCPVFDGTTWHIYGSGGSVISETWQILHATAPALSGPWTEVEPVDMGDVSGPHVAAPGVIYSFEERRFHMFVQSDFLAVDGTVEHLVSDDGHHFVHTDTALVSIPDSHESGIYDPHPASIAGKKYLTYSGTPRITRRGASYVSQPDIFLAESATGAWSGPWIRRGKILDHDHVKDHHNQLNDESYEWGLEGPQLIELPDGQVLLNATCFLPGGRFGTRQRVFFALAQHPLGPYRSLGIIPQTNLQDWESGENGHAAGFIQDRTLVLYYQARSARDTLNVHLNDWRYGIATLDVAPLLHYPESKESLDILE